MYHKNRAEPRKDPSNIKAVNRLPAQQKVYHTRESYFPWKTTKTNMFTYKEFANVFNQILDWGLLTLSDINNNPLNFRKN